jgi:hypothetical protein
MTRTRTALAFSALLTLAIGLAPATASASTPQASGTERIAGGRVVPVSTRGPAWYDRAYFRRVMEAGTNGVRVPKGAVMPTAVGLAYPGIRPGQWLVTVTTDPVGFAWCTANFVFAKNPAVGLGTAGHCAAKDALGGYPDVTAYVVPPPASGKLPGFYHIGKFVRSHNRGIGDDFAMISISPAYRSWVSPTMPVWGGPTGKYTSTMPTLVKHFGHGAAIGTGGTPRAGVCPILNARKGMAFAWYGAGTPGDSGSGVEAVTGQAVGNFTHIVILDGVPGEILPGMLAGTRITKIMRIASGWTLKLGSLIPV